VAVESFFRKIDSTIDVVMIVVAFFFLLFSARASSSSFVFDARAFSMEKSELFVHV